MILTQSGLYIYVEKELGSDNTKEIKLAGQGLISDLDILPNITGHYYCCICEIISLSILISMSSP